MSQNIKFAVIGYGYIGKYQAEMIRKNTHSELIAICDILPAKECGADTIKETFFNSYDKLLSANLNLDVINICVPNGLHTGYAIKALEKNLHVVVEKPLALTRNDAEKLISKSTEKKRHVFCIMQNRYSSPSKWLKSIVTDKTIGEPLMVQINCYWNRDDRYYKKGSWHGTANLDGGTLFTQFSHFIDTMYWLFGDITNIQGKFKNFRHKDLTSFEDSGFVNFDFVNGGMGSLNYSTAIHSKNFESSITIIGSKGTVKVSGQYMNEITYCDIEDYKMPLLQPSKTLDTYEINRESDKNRLYFIENIIDNLQKKDNNTSSVIDGMKVVDIIERIYKVRDKQGY